MADTGIAGVWKEVETIATELIEIVDSKDLFDEDLTQWENIKLITRDTSDNRIGPYLYLLRGRAILEITNMGAVTDKEQSLARAVSDLEKVKEVDPDNISAYKYLAQAIIAKGEILASTGALEQRDEAGKQAEELLTEAIELVPDDPQAHINLLTIKSSITMGADTLRTREQLEPLEAEYLELVDKFSSSSSAFSVLANFYRRLGHKYLDKAIDAVEKAIELDSQNVSYARTAANLHYQKFSMSLVKDEPEPEQLHAALRIAQDALALPDAQEVTGPRSNANRLNRLSLYSFLANCYIHIIEISFRLCQTNTTVNGAFEKLFYGPDFCGIFKLFSQLI